MNGHPPRNDPAAAPARAARARSLPRFALLVLGALATGLAAATAPEASERPPTAADCTSLLHQFDVAWPSHKDNPLAAGARHNRDLGDVNCSQRHYSDGVHLIRRALHDIGVKPVKIVAAAPGR